MRCGGKNGLPRRCAPRNDRVFAGCGACRAGRRGNRRSAAGGGRSEPVSRKCPDWRPRQWAGIGWHDGGQSPPPTDAWQNGAMHGKYVSPHRPAHWFAMTRVFASAEQAGGQRRPPLRILCKFLRRAGLPHPAADDPCSFRKCHCEEQSDAAIRFPCVTRCGRRTDRRTGLRAGSQ